MKSRHKLIYISDSSFPSPKANTINVMKMCEAFTQLGQEVVLVVPAFKKPLHSAEAIFNYYGIEDHFRIVQIPLRRFRGVLYWFAWQVKQWVRREETSRAFFFGRSLFSLYLLGRSGYPVAIDLHGKTWTKGRLQGRAMQALAQFPTTAFISFNSKQLKEEFQKDFSASIHGKLRLKGVQNGASLPTIVKDFANFKTAPTLNIGYVGSIIAGRGVDLVLSLAQIFPQFRFHLAGGTPEDIDKLGPQPDNIVFYGHIPHEQTYSLRAKCDVLLAPYQAKVYVASGENTAAYMSPIKLFEYMSSKSAIIATDLPAIRAVLSEEQALLKPADDLEAWSAAIQELTNDDLRQRLAEAAYQHFIENYTWKKRAEKILKLINQ